MRIAAAVEQLRRAFKEEGMEPPVAIVVTLTAKLALELRRDHKGALCYPDVRFLGKASIAGIDIRSDDD